MNACVWGGVGWDGMHCCHRRVLPHIKASKTITPSISLLETTCKAVQGMVDAGTYESTIEFMTELAS